MERHVIKFASISGFIENELEFILTLEIRHMILF